MVDPTTESIEHASTITDDGTPRAPAEDSGAKRKEPEVYVLIEGAANRVLWVGGAKGESSEQHDPRSGARIVFERRQTDMLGAPHWAFAGRFYEGDDVYTAVVQLARVRTAEREAMRDVARGAAEHARILLQGLHDVVPPEILDSEQFKAWSAQVTSLLRAVSVLLSGGAPVSRTSPEGLARALVQDGFVRDVHVRHTWALVTEGK